MKTFTLNSGNTYTQQDNGYCFATIDGKKTRCSTASFKMAHDQFVKEENERQNAANEFTNVDALSKLADNVIDRANSMKRSNDQIMIDCGNIDWYAAMAVKEHIAAGVITESDCDFAKKYSNGQLVLTPCKDTKAEEPKTEQPKATKRTNKRVSKKTAWGKIINGVDVSLTEKQVDFIHHLPDTCFWENGLDSTIWVDCLCDDITGQFANKPMTVGAMISTLCEKGLGTRATCRREKRKCTSFELTELGKLVAAELGLH